MTRLDGDLTRRAPVTAARREAGDLAAVAGGILIFGVAALVVASVLGRWLLNKPIPADYELVEIGVGIAIFAFLSYTQLRSGHIAVDTFTGACRPHLNAAIDGVWSMLLCGFLALFTWGLVPAPRSPAVS